MMGARELLLVEDDLRLRRALARVFQQQGWLVVEAGDLQAAREAGRPTLARAVVDLRLPDGSGIDLVEPIRRAAPGARIVVLSGWGSIATALEAVRRGASDFLSKPVATDRLLRAVSGEPAAAGPDCDGDADRASVPSLDRVEWEHIQRVMVEVDGNVSQAARLLGLHRRSLQRKLSKRPPNR